MSAAMTRPPAAPVARDGDRGDELVRELDREELLWARLRWLTVVCAVLALAFGVLLSVSGCTKERPACSPQVLAAIETQYVAEAVQTCAGHTFETCPGLDALEAKYRAKREEWIACR